MPTNDRDLQALTYLAGRLRDETMGAGEWDAAGIHAVIKGFVGHNLAVTIERVTRHAADTEARTPKAMDRPFVPDAPKAAYRHPVKAGTDCRLHVGEDSNNCRACASDRLAGTTTERPTNPAPDTKAHVAHLRAIRNDTVANFCSHGVDARSCLDHRPKPVSPS